MKNSKSKVSLLNDYFVVTKIITFLTRRSDNLRERFLITITILSLLAIIFLYILDEWHGLALLSTPSFLLMVIWMMISPIIIDLIEYQIDLFKEKYIDMIGGNSSKDEKKQRRTFELEMKKMTDPNRNMVGTASCAIIITIIFYFIIPKAVEIPGHGLLFSTRVLLTILSIFPAIILSNMIVISYNLITILPNICKLQIQVGYFEMHKLKDLGGISSFVLTTTFLISSISLIIPHTVFQIHSAEGDNLFIPIMVMFTIIIWILIIIISSLYFIHGLVLKTKYTLLEDMSKKIFKYDQDLSNEFTNQNKMGVNISDTKFNIILSAQQYLLSIYDRIRDTPEWPFDRDAIIGIISSIGLPIISLLLSIFGFGKI